VVADWRPGAHRWLRGHADAIFLIVLMVVLAGAVLVRAEQIDNATRQALCPLVRLALQHPVPYPSDPKANPSRLAAWQSYQDFVIIDRRYGCGD